MTNIVAGVSFVRVASPSMRHAVLVLTATLVFIFCSCRSASRPTKAPIEQDLRITVGGFLEGGDEQQKLDGVCGTDDTRNVFNCDIYNGLPNWGITELVIRVVWAPYSAGNVRDFREQVSIPPLTTASLRFRLGTQLPEDTMLFHGRTQQHWEWLVVGAKGIPARSASN
jgi:hypothetical protein